MAGHAPHVIARRKRGARPGHLAITGHTGTVWQEPIVAEWPFAITDGVATGPGSGDINGNLVMAIAALEAPRRRRAPERDLLPADRRRRTGQSHRSRGRRSRAAQWRGLGALTGSVRRRRPGLYIPRRAGGPRRHYPRPLHTHITAPDGISAVSEMARKIIAYEGVATGDGEIICGVGVAKGGVAKQVVPDLAEVIIDLLARSAESKQVGAARLS